MTDGWVEKDLLDCVELLKGPSKIPRKEVLSDGPVPVVSQEQSLINGFWSNSDDMLRIQRPVVIFGDHTRTLKFIDFDFAVGADGVKVLNAKDFLDPKFLYYFLLSRPVKALGYSRHFRLLKEIQLRFPSSLPEQKRIVAILDEAFAGIDQAIANTEKNLANAKELFESYLHSIFFNEGEEWEKKPVSEIASHSLGKMLDKQKNKGVPKPYLRNINVRWFHVDESDLLEMRFEPAEFEKYTVKKGDVVVCEGGYPGRAAIWDDERPIYFQKAIHRVRFHNPIYSKWFVFYLYLADQTKELHKYFTGAGIQHFTGKALARFSIPVPPESVVKACVINIEKVFDGVLKLEKILQNKITSQAQLKQSLLHKAFSGELTAKPEETFRKAVG